MEPLESAAIGKYQLFAVLGRGGMGDVYLGVTSGPRGFSKLVVVKCLRFDADQDEQSTKRLVEMFFDEGRLAARLNHSNVVATYEVGEHAGSYFIAMEHVDGPALSSILSRRQKLGGRLPPSLAARILSDAASGLHHAHELVDYDGTPLGIVHRDVSPHNILVSYQGQAKLADFGVAKALTNVSATESGIIKGKLRYMAPEQVTHGEIDRRTDVFAMGLVLWEVLAGRRLLTGEELEVMQMLRGGDLPRVSSVVPDVDPVLDDITARALATDPDKRFQTALELREALEEWMVSSGEGARQEDVGAYVRKLFDDVRQDNARKIREQMGRVSAATSLGSLAPLPLAGAEGSGTSDAKGVSVVAASAGRGGLGGRTLAVRAAIGVAIVVALGVTFARVFWPPGHPSAAPASTDAPRADDGGAGDAGRAG